MRKICLFLSLGGAVLLCGCNKQAKVNSQKIDLLSARIVQLEQTQAKQAAQLQAQLISLAPQLDKMNSVYFEKNRDDAIFFHTNTLYLLLTIGKQIETQLETADAERQAQNSLAYAYHTNQINTMFLTAAQIEEAMTGQESRIEDKINAETKRTSAALSDALLNQIKLSSVPDAAEIARRQALEAKVNQIQRDLNEIKARLAITNQPAR